MSLRECGFLALKRNADEQRKLPWRDIFSAKEVDRLDREDFGDSQSRNCLPYRSKAGALAENQGEIALDGREARDGLVFPRGARLLAASVEGVDREFCEKYVLPSRRRVTCAAYTRQLSEYRDFAANPRIMFSGSAVKRIAGLVGA